MEEPPADKQSGEMTEGTEDIRGDTGDPDAGQPAAEVAAPDGAVQPLEMPCSQEPPPQNTDKGAQTEGMPEEGAPLPPTDVAAADDAPSGEGSALDKAVQAFSPAAAVAADASHEDNVEPPVPTAAKPQAEEDCIGPQTLPNTLEHPAHYSI
ncbi:unnamed protein product [Symbiodinium natans]|uniref:Uncharacterized protein n=1 Tax=Symbiodinium natans TaxID=878477 RepID=A0A812TRX8_9DINO|nr:unnamed protein product [Symbiodinium natans]